MGKLKFMGLVLCWIVCTLNSLGQEKVVVDLSTILSLGEANNLTLSQSRNRKDLAQSKLAEAKEWWLPTVQVGAKIHQLWGASMNTDGRIFTDLNRQYFWGGMSLDANWDFAENSYAVKSAELSVKAKEKWVLSTRNSILFEMIKVYFDAVVASRDVAGFEGLLAQSDTIVSQLEVAVGAGIRYESELLVALSNKSQLEVRYLHAQNEYSNGLARLKNLLNLSFESELVLEDTSLKPLDLVPVVTGKPTLPLILESRPDAAALGLELTQLEIQRKSVVKSAYAPTLRLGTYSSAFGDVFSPLYPTQAINASLLWDIPLGRMVYHGEIQAFDAKIKIQQNRIDQMTATLAEQVQTAKQRLLVSHQQMELAKEGINWAKKALDQSITRQHLGLAIPFEMLQNQEVLMKSQLQYNRAVANFNLAQFEYKLATGEDL